MTRNAPSRVWCEYWLCEWCPVRDDSLAQQVNVICLFSNTELNVVMLNALRTMYLNVIFFFVQVKSKGKELYAAVARHMSSLGMKSCDIFGLAIQIGKFESLILSFFFFLLYCGHVESFLDLFFFFLSVFSPAVPCPVPCVTSYPLQESWMSCAKKKG